MVGHWDHDSEDAGGVPVHADEYFHVAVALVAREGGGDGGADGGLPVLGVAEGGEPDDEFAGLGWHVGGG